MTTDCQIVSALGRSGLELHSWDWTQCAVTCQVPAVQMRVSKLGGERVVADLRKQKGQQQICFSVHSSNLAMLHVNLSYLQSGVSNAPVKFAGEMTFDLSEGYVFWETTISNNMSVVFSCGLGHPGSIWLTEVDIEEATFNRVPIIPLKSIHQ